MTEGWLYGWKAICDYLGCSLSTAKRYHYRLCMPVYREMGKPVALKYDLDRWLVKANQILSQKNTKLRRS